MAPMNESGRAARAGDADPPRPPRAIAAAFLLLILAGAALAVTQYAFNRSLWHDEAVLANNIVSRDFRGLARPLDFEQVAPIGYLWATKLATLVLGDGEYGLRAVPLLCFLAAIPLFYLLAARLTGNGLIALLAAAVFSLSRIILIYASEAKQYSPDVLVAVLMLYLTFALTLNRAAGEKAHIAPAHETRSLVLYAVAGSLAVWFSNTAVIVLAACGLYVFYREAYEKRNFRILRPFLAWAASFSIYFLLFIHNHPHRSFHAAIFRDHFMPLNPLSKEFYGFLPKAIEEIYFNLGFGRHWLLPVIVSMIGVGFAIRRRRSKAVYFFMLPPLLHLLLSGLKMYPFIARAALYLTPMTILMYAIGLHDAFEFIRDKIVKLPRLVLIVPALFMLYPIAQDFPVENQELRASLEHLRRSIRPGESVYVYYGARHAFAYYKDRMGIDNPVTVGAPYPGRYQVFDEELSKLAGRVYVVFSHVYPFTPGNDEETYMVDFLRRSGAELLDSRKFRGSSVYHFDTLRPGADSK